MERMRICTDIGVGRPGIHPKRCVTRNACFQHSFSSYGSYGTGTLVRSSMYATRKAPYHGRLQRNTSRIAEGSNWFDEVGNSVAFASSPMVLSLRSLNEGQTMFLKNRLIEIPVRLVPDVYHQGPHLDNFQGIKTRSRSRRVCRFGHLSSWIVVGQSMRVRIADRAMGKDDYGVRRTEIKTRIPNGLCDWKSKSRTRMESGDDKGTGPLKHTFVRSHWSV